MPVNTVHSMTESGKGSAGAALQNLNLLLGCDEFEGIEMGNS